MRAQEKYTDAELIAAISAGRDLNDAIRYLYRQYSQATSSFIIQLGGSEQDADDIFQETVVAFIEVVQKGKYRMEASVKTFLNSIARNYWFNEIKKRDRSDLRDRRFEMSRDKDEADVSHYISEMERKRQLRDLVDQLGESCRKVLLLFYYENLSFKEMVDHLPYDNEQVVRNKKYKCLQALTGLIKDNPAIARQMQEILK
ncbi:MAG TPA: sigma-70 family RNA polymerase sigma factor [Puia sp.]|jgi:RNA polymerase sigma factor (sigma-70 family)|nr:sigma-70 family RNA polymerase sigma factor [Puia sp.]